MGKKSRRRPVARNKATQRQQVVETEEPPPAIERPPSIHELDDLEAAVAWMRKGRVDAKGFAKHLPHTAQALQEGKVTPKQVASDLKDVYYFTNWRLCTGEEMTPMRGVARLSALAALPERFFRSQMERHDVARWFSHELEAKLTEGNMMQLNGVDDIEVLLKESVDELCRMCAPRLDRELFHGRMGSFLKRCPLYGIAPEEYSKADMPLRNFFGNVDHDYQDCKARVAEIRISSIFTAAQNVATGFHDVLRMCWECNTVCQDLKSCARCETAQYCSKECQRTAWKNGHKNKCELLGCKYAALEDSLQAMDEYHSLMMMDNEEGNNFAKNGLSLSYEADFENLEWFFKSPFYDKELGVSPSMRLYYENLERVARGEFWFFPDASEASYREASPSKKNESMYLTLLCEALCYDYDEYNEFIDMQLWRACCKLGKGAQMPASVFKDLYTKKKQSQDSADRFRLRRESKRMILQHFMENDHS